MKTGGGWWRRRVVLPILAQLRQGITPEKIALTIALGTMLGVFPILGTTTLLCTLAGIRLRLNQPVIQLVNFVVYPLQLALLIPFYRAGELLFRQPPVPLLSVTDLVARFNAGPGQFLIDYALVGVYGAVVWTLVAPFAVAGMYAVLRPLLRGLKASNRSPPEPTTRT